MRFFIDKDREPTVYTNLFGKKIRRDFNNARIAERMDGPFKGKLILIKQRLSDNDFDAYNYKYPGGSFGYAVNIYDDSISSSLTPGRIADCIEKVARKMGKWPFKRALISNGELFKDSEAEAMISRDIIIFDGRKNISDQKLTEDLFHYGICNLCDYTLRLNNEEKSPFHYSAPTDARLAELFAHKEKESSTIALTKGWYFDAITKDLFEDRDIQNPLESAYRIINEIKDCAAGKDFTFAKRVLPYYQDINNARIDHREYYLVMKNMLKEDIMSEKPKCVTTREELEKVIFGESKRELFSTKSPTGLYENRHDRFINATRAANKGNLKDDGKDKKT